MIANAARASSRLLAALALAAAALAPSAASAQTLGFSSPTPVNNIADTDVGTDGFVDLATNGAGVWIAVWESNENLGGAIGTDFDILVAVSNDNGANWSPAAALNDNAATDSGDDRSPSIASDGAGNWVVVWQSNDALGGAIGTDQDILVSSSADNGANWSPATPLNGNAGSDSGLDSDPVVETDGSGTWIAAWNSNEDVGGMIGGDFDILMAISGDNGMSWSGPDPLNANANADFGLDFLPRLAADGAAWVAVWESSETLGGAIGTDSDILVARSTDGGANWTFPVALNGGAAADGAASDNFADIATDGMGTWMAAWQSDNDLGATVGPDEDILVATSTDNGATWSSPIALNSSATTDSGQDVFPELAADGVGNWVAVWQSSDSLGATIGLDRDVLAARSTDGGATWTPAAALNDYAATDADDDLRPRLATDGMDNWVAVWHSSVDLGSLLGPDADILASASFGLPVEISGFGLE